MHHIINISHASVATRLMCGEIFNDLLHDDKRL